MTTQAAIKLPPLPEMQWDRPSLYPKQRDAFFNDKRYSLCEATTKAGKTVGGMTWLVERGLRGIAGQNRWWVAPTIKQAKIAYKRIKRGLPRDMIRCWETDRIIELPSLTLLHFLSGDDPDGLYGEDVFDAVIDEASRCREEAFHAVRSTVTHTGGFIRMIGNVKGRQNWFYRMARRAEGGDPDMHYSKITAADAVAAGIVSAREIEDARRNLPEHIFRELYMAEPSDDGGNPFGLKAIGECVAPLSRAQVKIWGIDLAKSHDWVVCIGLDQDGQTAVVERWQSPWPETKARIRSLVGMTKAYVDSTGVGDPIVDDLQRNGHSNYEGFKFTAPSKQMLMEGLAAAIQERSVRFPEGVVRLELETFEYQYNRTGVRYSAPEGLHDDCVCALALAVHHRRHRPDLGQWKRFLE